MTKNRIEDKTAIIIGAGIGGLATAILLANQGYKVQVFEKNGSPGGRCGQMIADGYRFDLGATMLMMPGIYRDIFGMLEIPLFEDRGTQPLEELYTLFFDNKESLVFTTDAGKMKQQMERMEEGSYVRMQEYIKTGYEIYQTGVREFIGRNFYHLFQFANFKNIGMLIRLKTYINHHAWVRRFFRHPRLQMAFTFQNIYVGQDPFRAPALFSMVPAAELTEGTYTLKGGMYALVEKLMAKAKEKGVRFYFDATVEHMVVNGRKATGIKLEDGQEFSAETIVCNADLPYAYRNLLPGKLKAALLKRMRYSCSALSFHWGLDKVYPLLPQHSIFLSDAYRGGLDAIFKDKAVNDEPCFYVHAPVRKDPAAAPDGHDNLSVIVGIGHIDQNKEQDWKQLKEMTRSAVLRRLKLQGLEDIEEHIKTEICLTPVFWENSCNISRGSVFGSLAHNLLQMGYFRPHNRHRRYRNLYFTGGSTHPGNGIPNVLLSAKLTTEHILKNKS